MVAAQRLLGSVPEISVKKSLKSVSRWRLANESGIVPLIRARDKSKVSSAARWPSEGGIVPEIRRLDRSSLGKEMNSPIVDGIVPLIPEGSCRAVSAVRPRESGIVPDISV
eukprot:SAG31_NODE_15453_length_754_cov_1.177099_1_plen_111_part_00